MPMTGARGSFETQPCTRCGGGGFYSYCQTWGHTCFQCGVSPGAPGLGKYLTRRGLAAYNYYMSLMPTKRAADLLPGDVVFKHGGRYKVLELVSPSTSSRLIDGEWVHEGVDIHCNSVTYVGVREDEAWSLVPSAEERQRCLDQALAYQATLTKRGTVRRRQRAAAA